MTRRNWLGIIGACLCAGLTSGCALLGFRSGPGPADKIKTVQVDKLANPTDPRVGPQDVVRDPPPSSGPPNVPDIAPPPREENGPVKGLPVSEAVIPEDVRHEEQPQQAPPAGVPAHPPEKDNVVAPAYPPAEPEEPLLVALAHLLKEDDQALAYLDRYDPATRDWFQRVLPLVAGLTKKGVEHLSPEDLTNIQQQLQLLLLEVRKRAALGIEKLCYCESADGAGGHKPLPESHPFLPKCGNRLGELVLLYAELHNLGSVPRSDHYETRTISSVTIRPAGDDSAKDLYRKNFEDRNRPLRGPTPSCSCARTYSFYVPACIPPGRYTLTLEVRDESTQPPRVVRKSLPFVVAAEGAGAE